MALFVLFNLDDAGLDHFVVKIVAFARAFADAGEHRDAAVQFRDVVDQFHDDDGLADAGAAEGAHLAALQKRADQVNDLDAGRQNLRAGGLVHERGRGAMNRQIFVGLHRALLVHGIAGHVENAAHHGLAHGHGNRRAGVRDFIPALEPLGGGHGDGAHPVVAEMLLHFERQSGFGAAGQVVFDRQGVVNGGQRAGKFHVHDRSDDLNDFTFVHRQNSVLHFNPPPSGRWQFPTVPW